MSEVIYPFSPCAVKKRRLSEPSASFDAACILLAFDLPQLLIGSACLALCWCSEQLNSIDKFRNWKSNDSFTVLLAHCVTAPF